MASHPNWPLLAGLCATLAGNADAAQQGVFAVRIELTIPPGCSSSVERTAGGGARVSLTCGDNLFVNVRPTLVSVAAPTATGRDTGAPAAAAPPAAGDDTGGNGQRDGVLYVLAASSDATEMWVIF